MPSTFARLLAVIGVVACGALATAGIASAATERASAQPNFGPNVIVFTPSMAQSQIQATLDSIATQQIPNQFGTQRYAIFFMPGTYGSPEQPLNFQVGYYEQVAGLGALPTDVQIYGTADIYNQCDANGSCTALVNFWRSLSNLTINVAGKSGCQVGEFWAASQAAPMRRVEMNGQMTLFDYCSQPSFSSGGFIADSELNGTVINGSQQQYYVRSSTIGTWTNGVWNQVFSGDTGAPAQGFPNPPYTTLATTPESREAPFLTVDSRGRYNVFVPSAQTNSAGVTWASGQTPGRSLPLSTFYVAHPGDSALKLDIALALGLNLMFTPGVYDINLPLHVWRPDTVVLGLGMATLTAQRGAVPMTVGDVPGVVISGLIFDAGPVNSPVLLQVGSRHPHGFTFSSPRDPTAIDDVFFRIGGPHVGKATVSLEVWSDNTILDDVWAWRADHGSGVGWTSNTADNGVVVNGDHVLATGLFVEHYQKYDVVWNGNHGETIFFQNEMPYDPPNQAAWQHDGLLGWAAFKVANTVTSFAGYGLGSYIFTNVDPTIHATHAFEVPNTPGVQLHDILDLSITSDGTIDHVVNDVGPPTGPNTVPNDIVSYP